MKKNPIKLFALLCVAFLSNITYSLLASDEIKVSLYKNETLLKAYTEISPEQNDNKCRVRFLWNNDESWYVRWKILEQATQKIDCTYFNIANDIFGLSFLGAINKKAKEGVKIRLMVDWRYAHFSTYMQGMIDVLQELSANPNVQIKLYNSPIKNWTNLFNDIKKLLACNHDKIIIVDNKRAIIGGRNIAADHFAEIGENKYVVRDADLLFEGENVCKYLTQAFEEEWSYLKNSVLKPDFINLKSQKKKIELAYHLMNKYLQSGTTYNLNNIKSLDYDTKQLLERLSNDILRFKNIKSYLSFNLWQGENKKSVKILDKTARVQSLNGITPALIKLIDASKHEIIIQNPYVLFTEQAHAALSRAAKRNVPIIIHTNSGWSTDEILPTAFLISELPNLIKNIPTLRIFVSASSKDTLHSKIFVFDRQITVVGSYNMDPLSQDVNSEVVAAIRDSSFSNMVALKILREISQRAKEYKAYIDSNGNVKFNFGPYEHLPQETLRKINLIKKFGWLRPLV